MNLNLRMAERLALASVLPQTGNFLTMSLVSDLRSTLMPDAAEMARLGFVNNETGVSWKNELDGGLDVTLSSPDTDLIKKSLLDMDKEGRLTQSHLKIYRVFVLSSDAEENKS